jgi:hypothetical protein
MIDFLLLLAFFAFQYCLVHDQYRFIIFLFSMKSISQRRLNEIIARVLFQENPTSSLALMNIPNPATYDAWINATSPSGKDKTWTSLDSNPFTSVSYKNYRVYNFCHFSFVTNFISSFLSIPFRL